MRTLALDTPIAGLPALMQINFLSSNPTLGNKRKMSGVGPKRPNKLRTGKTIIPLIADMHGAHQPAGFPGRRTLQLL